MANQSVDFFSRLVKEKHNKLIKSINDLLRDIAKEDISIKKISAQNALASAIDLRSNFVSPDVPNWLQATISCISNLVNEGWTPSDFLLNFLNIKTEMDSHTWVFDQNSDSVIDFDSIFENYRKEGRLPQLFDEIIVILEQIQNSGQVDSITMLRAFDKVILTLKKCKNGSYFSLNSAWEFLLGFLNNYMWGELSKIPLLGTAFEALQKTLEETNEQMFIMHQKIQENLQSTAISEVAALSNKTSFSFVTYDRIGHTSNLQTNRQLPDTLA